MPRVSPSSRCVVDLGIGRRPARRRGGASASSSLYISGTAEIRAVVGGIATFPREDRGPRAEPRCTRPGGRSVYRLAPSGMTIRSPSPYQPCWGTCESPGCTTSRESALGDLGGTAYHEHLAR